MKSYRQFCPLARASEVLAERWTLIILRNIFSGCHTFSEILDGAPGLSRTLLTQRLRTLERYRILERRVEGRTPSYRLTPVGQDLMPVLEAVGTWGARWLDLGPDHMDPYVVLWDISRMIERQHLPDERTVIRFDLTDRTKMNRFWLVLEPGNGEVCTEFPGYTEDLVVTTDSETLTHWHIGWIELRQAIADNRIVIEGPQRSIRAFVSHWQGLSMFAKVKRATTPA